MSKGKSSKILKGALRTAIKDTGGNVSEMADRFGVSRQTIYNRLDHYELRGELHEWRRLMFEMAEGNVFDAVAAGDTDLSKFVLTHFPGGNRWSSRHEVEVGAVKLSPQVLKLLDEMGIGADDVAVEFEALIQQIHAETVNRD